jgi:acyl-coenzyme A thioesterase PaaI-like protein
VDDLPLLNPPDITTCFVCGGDNPEGLALRVHRDGTDAVARFTSRPAHSGYPDRLHGGIVGMLVDEMLVYAGVAHGLVGMTAKVRYWLRRPIPLGETIHLRGRLVQQSDRGFRAVVSIRLADDRLAAEGEGMCVLRAPAGAAAGEPSAGLAHEHRE